MPDLGAGALAFPAGEPKSLSGLEAYLQSDQNLARDLSVALPKRVLVDDLRVVHRRLDVSGGIHRARSDGVLARCGTPSDGPEFPRELARAEVERRSYPAAAVNLDLDARDLSAPGRAGDAILRTWWITRPGAELMRHRPTEVSAQKLWLSPCSSRIVT
jgi:hypothetical protein